MYVVINGKNYEFVKNPVDPKVQESYFGLIEDVFGLDFRPWYGSECNGESFIPYILLEGGNAVASVGVLVNHFNFNGVGKKYVQLSTIATAPNCRKQGLSQWLMEKVLLDWKDHCDAVYLYASDSVVDFYPKFGFVPEVEHHYSMPLTPDKGNYRLLDLENEADIELLMEKFHDSNPYSAITLEEDSGIVMFHCFYFLEDNIYYLPEAEAIVIAKVKGSTLFCYDIYATRHRDIKTLLGCIAPEGTTQATLGFTPKNASVYDIAVTREQNTTLFVLQGKENIFTQGKITLPHLSRA